MVVIYFFNECKKEEEKYVLKKSVEAPVIFFVLLPVKRKRKGRMSIKEESQVILYIFLFLYVSEIAN